jgi:hypothetical protein
MSGIATRNRLPQVNPAGNEWFPIKHRSVQSEQIMAHNTKRKATIVCLSWGSAMDSDELVASDVVMPSQWLSPRSLCRCGCHRLMFEILADAFLTLVRPPPGDAKDSRARWEAVAWFQQPFRSAGQSLRLFARHLILMSDECSP